MKHVSYRSLLSILVMNLAFISVGSAAENKGIESLSPEVRGLLKQEMSAIEVAMKDIISANANGDSEKIAVIAQKIKDSFILKQHLTKHQKHELHSVLSADFIKQDQRFHYNAGMLAHAAQMKKPELINFYYGQLFEACASCHKVHAIHRFPQFSLEAQAVKHEH